MQIFKKFALGLTLAMAVAATANADVIQSSVGNGSYDGYQAWGSFDLGDVTLAHGTNSVSALNTTATLWDQGWGGSCDCNQVYVGLFQNGNQVWSQHVAGAGHGSTTVTYDIGSDATALTSLNATLATIDWSNTQSLTMEILASPIGWGGWELHVRNAAFTMSSSDVPEPASLALLGMGFAGLAAARRRKSQK